MFADLRPRNLVVLKNGENQASGENQCFVQGSGEATRNQVRRHFGWEVPHLNSLLCRSGQAVLKSTGYFRKKHIDSVAKMGKYQSYLSTLNVISPKPKHRFTIVVSPVWHRTKEVME